MCRWDGFKIVKIRQKSSPNWTRNTWSYNNINAGSWEKLVIHTFEILSVSTCSNLILGEQPMWPSPPYTYSLIQAIRLSVPWCSFGWAALCPQILLTPLLSNYNRCQPCFRISPVMPPLRAATFVPPLSDQKKDQDAQWSPKPKRGCFYVLFYAAR